MSNSVRKLDVLFRSAEAARARTIAAGVRAWRWLRTQKNGRIGSRVRHATLTLHTRIVSAQSKFRVILGRSQPTVADITETARTAEGATHVVTRSQDPAVARATAEMMARIRAEQQAIQRRSKFFELEVGSQADPAPVFAVPPMEFVSSVSLLAFAASRPTSTDQAVSARPLLSNVTLQSVADCRPLVASRERRPSGGVRCLRHGMVDSVRRPLVTDPLCRGAGRAADLDEDEDFDLRLFPAQWQSAQPRDDAPRFRDRSAKLHHASRKARASRR